MPMNARNSFLSLLLAMVLSFAATGAARAQSCSFSVTDMNFATVETLSGTATDIAGNIHVNCSAFLGLLSSITGNIHFGEGDGGGDGTARQMQSATTSTALNYQLYKDSARSVVLGGDYWGHGETIDFSGFALLLIGSGTADVPFYGRVFGGQTGVAPGSYLSSFFRNPIDARVNYRTCDLLLLCTDRTATFSFDVLAEVEPECLVSASDLDFGTAGVLSSAIDASSTLSVTCTAQTDYDIGLDYGFYGTGALARYMRSGAGHDIRYELYRDAGRSQPWGTLPDGQAQPGSGTGSTQVFSVHGRVPAQTTPPAGSYSDTVVVTVTY